MSQSETKTGWSAPDGQLQQVRSATTASPLTAHDVCTPVPNIYDFLVLWNIYEVVGSTVGFYFQT